MRAIMQIVRAITSAEADRTYEFDERFTVEDGGPMRTDLTLDSGGRVEYTCRVRDGKEVVAGLVAAEEAERVHIGVKDRPEFVKGTRRTVRPGESVSESVTVPGGEYFVLVATDPEFFYDEATVVDGDVTGAIVELSGEATVHYSSFLNEKLTP